MVQTITEYINGCEGTVALQDIYKAFPDMKPYIVRSILNIQTKRGRIQRIERGVYKKL